MSLYLEFEPHSWYKGFAIKKTDLIAPEGSMQVYWEAYTDNGNTYRVDSVEAETLKELKQKITEYRLLESQKFARLYNGVQK